MGKSWASLVVVCTPICDISHQKHGRKRKWHTGWWDLTAFKCVYCLCDYIPCSWKPKTTGFRSWVFQWLFGTVFVYWPVLIRIGQCRADTTQYRRCSLIGQKWLAAEKKRRQTKDIPPNVYMNSPWVSLSIKSSHMMTKQQHLGIAHHKRPVL